MSHTSHLQKFASELKCPICLGLLNEAVSLTCNHVFCNKCIVQSMKSGSDCPICKVPYSRREVRPTPHMDNLVSIYKNMEVASGSNILVSQNATPRRVSDNEDKDEGDQTRGDKTKTACQKKARNRKSTRANTKVSKKSLDSNPNTTTGTSTLKPTFPKQKRVQVAHYPLPETPTQPAKYEVEICDITSDEIKYSSFSLDEQMNKKGEPVFSPLFWLRDDKDMEKLSPETDSDNARNTPPVAPCFSDIKNSDDEMFSEKSPEGGLQSKFGVDDGIDGEVFEWTQRACSPELCMTPTETQVEDTYENYRHLINDIDASLQVRDTPQESDYSGQNSARIQNGNNKNVFKKSSKRGKKVSEGTQEMFTQLETDRDLRTRVDPKEVYEMQDVTCTNKTNHLELEKRGTIKIAGSEKNVQDSPSMKKCTGSSKRKSLEKIYMPEGHRNDDMNPQLPIPIAECNELTNLSEQSKKNDKEIKSTTYTKSSQAKKLKFSFDNTFEDILKDTGPVKKGQNGSDTDTKAKKDSSEVEKGLAKTTGTILCKFEMVNSKIQCTFCHSAANSEASGDMVHYFNGRPVAADHNGGFDVIHSHRNCTEWAPNVYFEDDTVKNLKAEIARSKRIACSVCGIKGAALGCFEKSCRKSFHVPCAKLMSECRWDTENFVILCPLHASSNLPSESPHSQRTRQTQEKQKQIYSEHINKKKISSRNEICASWNLRGSLSKIKLCCSALTVQEKEIVSEFKKVSGITEMKKWSSSVTHVIASTDENGACRRTLKFFMGILEGKWILSIDWIKACIAAMEPVGEAHYEIKSDIHGITNGPRIGQQRLVNKEPKLFDRFNFYFSGDFIPSYKGYLQELVTAAGGTILHRKPVSVFDQNSLSETFKHSTLVIYSQEPPDKCVPHKSKLILKSRQSDAEAIASSAGAKVATNSWILNSIAACKLQNMT